MEDIVDVVEDVMSNNSQFDTNAYKESTWGKKLEGEFIIDGYKFKGRQPFRKAKEEMEKLMIKGRKSEINGLKFTVLDAREKGIETEVEVKIEQDTKMGVDKSGIAVLKLYGPNKRKENSILVTKSKDSDIVNVTILAEKIVRPLLARFLGLSRNEEFPQKIKEEIFSCDKCEKIFQTNRGLKGHKTKAHKDIILETQDLKRKAIQTVENETDDEVIVEDIIEEKKYSNTCSKCNLHMEATRKYVLIQDIKKHKRLNCQKTFVRYKSCVECGYEARDESTLKRHKRDKHEELTSSTSPPPKKSRMSKYKKDYEEMEIGENDETVYDMEVESVESEELVRSKLMDQKIIAKALEQEQKEQMFQQKRRTIELEKKKMEEIRMEATKQLNKKRKQKAKDVKKRLKRQNSSKNTSASIMDKIPNIKSVPSNCTHLVNKGDKVYQVPGNGACFSNSAAAHLFKDEVFGTKLRRGMNHFFAKHFEKKYKFLTPCSKETPFSRKIGGGGTVSFTEPSKLIQFLKHSEEADFMWSDSEDLSVLSDMYQVKIKIITTKGEKDTNPTINWITPDEELKEDAELQNVDIEDMVLLHTNDCHFDLIVSETSDLAVFGSLSYRSNIGPINDKHAVYEDKTVEDEKLDREKNLEFASVQQKLNDLQIKHEKLESEYKQCVSQLKRKTEDEEKLKIEVKDLKTMMELMENAEKDNDKSDIVNKQKKTHQTSRENTSNKCDNEHSRKSELNEHIGSEHVMDVEHPCAKRSLNFKRKEDISQHIENSQREDLEYNCNDCCYQATSIAELKMHIKRAHINNEELYCSQCKFQASTNSELRAHKVEKHPVKDSIRCRICGEVFEYKPLLMQHRKNKHAETVNQCKNNAKGDCPFSSVKCWWRHEILKENDKHGQDFKCYNCSESFNNKGEMMMHKKRKHPSSVRYCNLYLDDKCRFNDQSCWYRHLRAHEEEKHSNEEKKIEQEVFQEVQEDLDPPIVNKIQINQRKF